MRNSLDIFSNTEASESYIAEFEYALTELINSSYILSEKKISAVLKIIAKSKPLYNLVEDCLKGFNFKKEFEKARVVLGDAQSLALPSGRKKLVAFMFCLFLSFDLRHTDFKKFLSIFYFSPEGSVREFEHFAKHAIKPFSEAILIEFHGEEEEAPQEIIDDHIAATVDSPKTETDILLDNLSFISEAVFSCKALPEVIKSDTLSVCEGFYSAVEAGDIVSIKTSFISLKNAVENTPLDVNVEQKLTAIEEIVSVM